MQRLLLSDLRQILKQYLPTTSPGMPQLKGHPPPTPSRWIHSISTPSSWFITLMPKPLPDCVLHPPDTGTSPAGRSGSGQSPSYSSPFPAPPAGWHPRGLEVHVTWLTDLQHEEQSVVLISYFSSPSGLRLSGVLKVKTTFSFISWVLSLIFCF